MISIIVAAAENDVIGKEGGLPWYLPAELAYFRQKTTGHPIVMGRKTHAAIGRALPDRTNIVITSNKNYLAEGCLLVNSLDGALEAAKKAPGSDEIFIIGGETVYAEALPLIDKIYLTRVHAQIEGDKFFKFDQDKWREARREDHSADDKNQYAFSFLVLEKA